MREEKNKHQTRTQKRARARERKKKKLITLTKESCEHHTANIQQSFDNNNNFVSNCSFTIPYNRFNWILQTIVDLVFFFYFYLQFVTKRQCVCVCVWAKQAFRNIFIFNSMTFDCTPSSNNNDAKDVTKWMRQIEKEEAKKKKKIEFNVHLYRNSLQTPEYIYIKHHFCFTAFYIGFIAFQYTINTSTKKIFQSRRKFNE